MLRGPAGQKQDKNKNKKQDKTRQNKTSKYQLLFSSIVLLTVRLSVDNTATWAMKITDKLKVGIFGRRRYHAFLESIHENASFENNI